MNTQTTSPAETPTPAKPKGQTKTPPPPETPKAPEPTKPPVVQKVFFRKELFSNSYFVGGKAVAFEQLDGNRGVLALTPGQDDALIAALNEAASKRIGGIVKISEGEYSAKKQEHPLPASATSGQRYSNEKLRIAPRAGMQGKAFRPPPPKGISQPRNPNPAAPAGTEANAPAASVEGLEVVDGVPQGPNPVPDFVPRLGRVGEAAKGDGAT